MLLLIIYTRARDAMEIHILMTELYLTRNVTSQETSPHKKHHITRNVTSQGVLLHEGSLPVLLLTVLLAVLPAALPAILPCFFCCFFHCALAYSCMSTTSSFSSTISKPSIDSMTSSRVTMPRRLPYSSMMIEMCYFFSRSFSHMSATDSSSEKERIGRARSFRWMENLSSASRSSMVWRST